MIPRWHTLTVGLLVASSLGSTRPLSSSAPDTSSGDGVEARVEALLAKMTPEEKIDLLAGVDGFFVRGVPRLGLPRLRMADGPMGVRNFGPATAMAAGIGLAASWNPALAERVGTEMGRDARAKGVHFLLAPGVNIYRAPMNGRNFEYFGEDPFLASRIAVGYIEGVQAQGVSATVKHFAGNNSEYDRHHTDSVIDERTLREIYLPVFEAAVKEARVGAVMDSYNLTNGAHMSQNAPLNVELLKKEWGFGGLLMSDWTSTYDTVAAANGGLDLEMPAGDFFNRQALLPALEQGKVSPAVIDDKVRRLLRTAARFGWLDREQTDAAIPRYNLRGREAALQSAREGIVLLKNAGGLLPWSRERLRSIAVIGPGAYPAVPVGGGSARVQPFAAVSVLEGLGQALGTGVAVHYHRGLPTLPELAQATSFVTDASGGTPGLKGEYFDNEELKGPPMVTRTDRGVVLDPTRGPGQTRFSFPERTRSERWTGFFVPARAGRHHAFVWTTGERGGSYRLYVDDTLVLDNWDGGRALVAQARLDLEARPHRVVLEHHGRARWSDPRLVLGIAPEESLVDPAAKALATNADAVVLAVGFDPDTESEGSDRSFGLPPGQDELIREVAAANRNVVVVVTAGGAVDTSSWLDRVPALLQAWYPGQEGGRAVAEILLGDVNPSGHLPVTFERRFEDNPVHDSYYPDSATRRIVYKEGVFVGYRGYEKNGAAPAFPFGHGLSYTTFRYGDLTLTPAGDGSAPRYQVAFDLTNTGARAGADVAQVYVAPVQPKVPRPPKELRGFAKVELRPGESKRVSVTLEPRAFSYFDPAARLWRADEGSYDLLVGRSSEQIELRRTITLKTAYTSR